MIDPERARPLTEDMLTEQSAEAEKAKAEPEVPVRGFFEAPAEPQEAPKSEAQRQIEAIFAGEKAEEAPKKAEAAPSEPKPAEAGAAETEAAGASQKSRRGKKFAGGSRKRGVFTPVLNFEGTENDPALAKPVKKSAVNKEMDNLSNIFGSAEIEKPMIGNEKSGVEPELPQIAKAEEPVKAPIVEPVQAQRRGRAQRDPNRVKPENPVSLAFADLSRREDLKAEEIEDASEIYGIKYPASFDTSTCDFTGRAIDYSDFSLCSSLRWEDIAAASDISGVKFPSAFDIENADFFDRSLRGCDFSEVYSMRWKHIEAAENIASIKYPPTFDIEEANFNARDISGSDFTLVKDLKWSHIENAEYITGVRFPENFDLSEADFSDRDLTNCDFSRVKQMKFEDIARAASIKGVVYPECFSFKDISFRGRDISNSDFSRIEDFDFEVIRRADSLRGIKYPANFDAETSDYKNRDITASNFSRVTTLRWKHIAKASSIRKLIYPPTFDIDEADFTGRDIDYSDFSLLPGINWDNVQFADSRDGIVYPAGFVEPIPFDDDVHGAMLIYLLKLYTREYKGELDADRFYADISALYPGIDNEKATNLINEATKIWDSDNGKARIECLAREAHIGDKLYMVKLGFKLLYPSHGTEKTVEMLRTDLGKLFKKREKQKLEDRLTDLSKGKYLSASEMSALGFVPEADHKAARQVAVEITEPAPEAAAEPAVTAKPEPAEIPKVEKPKVYTFGQMPVVDAPIDETPFDLSSTEILDLEDEVIEESEEKAEEEIKAAEPAEPVKPAEPAPKPVIIDDVEIKPVDLTELKAKKAEKARRSGKLSDEEKGIRTGVMGMLQYISRNVSDESLTNSELFSEFLKIYPGAAAKEVAAMAQFANNTLNGNNTDTRAKLFLFASKAPTEIKHKLLDFAYNRYLYRLTETEEEEIFREFMMALCGTLFDDSPEYEYSNFMHRHDILKKPAPPREAAYRRISFDANVGRANLYANERFPYYRTLQQLGFTSFTFDALRSSLYIEVGDSRPYEELGKLCYREKQPGLMQFVVIETNMGYLYLEQRCIRDWDVTEETVWRTAERNMQKLEMRPRYSFSTVEYTSFRYLQGNLASWVLTAPKMLEELSKGKDIILAAPCREIVYIDFYEFVSVKKLIDFVSRYNCTLMLGGEEYEHPITGDVFIYHADDKTLERVNDESYILLGDSVARREVLHSVLPLNMEVDAAGLRRPKMTDELEAVNDEQITIQEAVYTILRLYSEMNGDRDYTIPYNAAMAIFDEVYFTSDSVYPPARGREQPDPMEFIDAAARLAVKGGKSICWLLIQALQHLCGDIKYETPTSASIRQTVLEQIYGDNASAVWLNCATAAEFLMRADALKEYEERSVENQRLTIIDSRLELLLHSLTLIFHQFGRKYALGQVRKHIRRAMPEAQFNYEINLTAWLPAPGDDVDVELQSQGMILRGFDRITQEHILSSIAAAIGDNDLSTGDWPLLVFIKLVKYAYLDPAEMVERFFVSRSRLIPSQAVLKQLYYKDLNNEFVKHSRKAARVNTAGSEDSFENDGRREVEKPEYAESFESVLRFNTDYEEETVLEKPEMQFRPVERGYLEKSISFVLEPINKANVNQLRDAAHFVTKLFHVPEAHFVSNDDIECELHYGILRRKVQLTTLRSMAWTLYNLMLEQGKEMRDVTGADVRRAMEIVEVNNRLNYKTGSAFPTLCSMSLEEGMFIPCYEQILYFAQELLPENKLYSLFALHDELAALAPAMKLIYDVLRKQKQGEILPPKGVLYDTICAWSALCFASADSFEVADGPSNYNYNQIKR